jgi:hypothetical protein
MIRVFTYNNNMFSIQTSEKDNFSMWMPYIEWDHLYFTSFPMQVYFTVPTEYIIYTIRLLQSKGYTLNGIWDLKTEWDLYGMPLGIQTNKQTNK